MVRLWGGGGGIYTHFVTPQDLDCRRFKFLSVRSCLLVFAPMYTFPPYFKPRELVIYVLNNQLIFTKKMEWKGLNNLPTLTPESNTSPLLWFDCLDQVHKDQIRVPPKGLFPYHSSYQPCHLFVRVPPDIPGSGSETFRPTYLDFFFLGTGEFYHTTSRHQWSRFTKKKKKVHRR